MTTDRDEYDIKRVLDELRGHEGRGTELISLYIPPDTNLSTVQQQVDNEYAQAENIKSDHTRDNVQDALSRVRSALQNYSRTPDNGLAAFAGVIDGEMVDYVFDSLPRPIPERNYICSDSFETGPLESVLTPDSVYGLIVLDRNEAAIGSLIGDRIDVHRELESGVMGKTKAGGQSAQRFARERERQKRDFFKKIGKTAKEEFIEDDACRVDGLLIGGTTITVDEFMQNDDLDHRLEDALLGTYGTSYGNEQGLRELVRKADDILSSHEMLEAKRAMDTFFDALSGGTDENATYGSDKVEQALEYGAVEMLLLSEDLEHDTVDSLSEAAQQTGAEILYIPDDFERGSQLAESFDGVAAILRYDVHLD